MAAVNRPTNIKQKEADVNQKLQLYGIYSGMQICSLCYVFLVLIVKHFLSHTPASCARDHWLI